MFYCRFEGANNLRILGATILILLATIDTFHPEHRSTDNEYIMSNRGNELLRNLDISQVYDLIHHANNINEVCGVVNYCPQDIGYDGYGDSRFFKVRY